ncbi:tyrosine-type recombinase/integrase [Nocardia higoensis]|uniref:Tyrosine-type recombinase/integrase n=1 Tax=Nocardia higoensis TaxID=228599 RepID=A0ABS0DL12_9NOCA|nr:tyrosine-type recombinase/integrase [Nocardia higoensis]MBF6358232.1 tyrosine-type recombinase/integrase [Nocardia higoensis]
MAQESLEPGALPPAYKLNPSKDPDGIWRLQRVRHRTFSGTYVRTSGSGRTRKECLEDWNANFERNRQKSSARATRDTAREFELSDKMSKALDAWFKRETKRCEAGKIRPQSLINYRRWIYEADERGRRRRGSVKLMKEMGHLTIREVGKPKFLADYFEDVTEIGPSIAAGHYMILTAVFNMLTVAGLFDVSPMHPVPALEGGGGKQRALTSAERDGFLELLEERSSAEWLKPYWLTLLGTGIRPGEAMALRWCDLAHLDEPGEPVLMHVCGAVVPLKGGRVRQPHRKRGKDYHLVLPTWLGGVLRGWRDWTGPLDEQEPVFKGARGDWLSTPTMSRALGEVKAGSELEWFTFGNCRDTVATHITGKTRDPGRASAQLGHSAGSSVALRFYIDLEGYQFPAVDNAEVLESVAPGKVTLKLESGGFEPGWFRV